MSGPPFFGSDGRPRIRALWSGPRGVINRDKEFLLDSGANRSGVSIYDAVSLTLEGVVNVGTATSKALLFEYSGGTIEFDVKDSSTGSTTSVQYSGWFLAPLQDIIGLDILRHLGVNLSVNYTVSPPSIELIK